MISLLLLSSPLYSADFPFPLSNNCTPKSERLVTRIPPPRSQGGVGLCYAFAATRLIEQKYCKNKKGGCWYFGNFSTERDFKYETVTNIENSHATSDLELLQKFTPEDYDKII